MNGRSDQPTAVKRLSEQDIQTLIIGVRSSYELWRYVATYASATDFLPGEFIYAAVWSAINRCWETYNGITRQLLHYCTQEALQSQGIPLAPEMAMQLFGAGGYLDGLAVYIAPEPELVRAGEVAKAFLAERCMVDRLQRVVQHTPPGLVPEAFGAAIQTAVDVYSQTQADPLNPHGRVLWSLQDVLSSTRNEDAVVAQPTGFWCVDEINGGQRANEVNGILGLSGGGKSTFATQLMASLVRRQSLLPTSQRKLQVYVTYEQRVNEIVGKVLSAAAVVRETVAEAMASGVRDPGWTSLEGGVTAQDTESTQLAFPGASQTLGEKERLEACIPSMHPYMAVVDHQLSQQRGGDFSPRGLVRELKAIQDQFGLPIGTVIVDYAGQACEAQIANSKRYVSDNVSMMASLLKQYSSECQIHIADQFAATVWVLQQLNPTLSGSGTGRLMVHQDAHYCRAFAEHQVSCVCLGNPDRKQGVVTLNWSKLRKTQVGSEAYTLLQKYPGANFFKRAAGFKITNRGRRCDIVSTRLENRAGDQFVPDSVSGFDAVAGDGLADGGALPRTRI